MEYPTQKLPFESLTTIDERVDFIHNQVAAVQGQLGTSQLALNQLLEKEVLPTMPKVQKQIVFKHTVLPLQGIMDHKRVPMLKTVKTITIHWPSGCSSLVDIAVGYSQDKRLLPEEGYLALDNVTPTWTVNKDVGDTDTLWVEIKNGSSINSYPISIIINYEELSGD